jgi:hypothetical protein
VICVACTESEADRLVSFTNKQQIFQRGEEIKENDGGGEFNYDTFLEVL